MAFMKLPGKTARVKAFGFDVDGVLRDTGYQAFENCCRAITELGGTPPEFKNFVHDWGGMLIEYYRSCGVTASDEEIRRVNHGYISKHDSVPPFEDVVETLMHLESLGIPLFALSGHGNQQLNAWFAEHNLHVRFAHIRGDGRRKVVELRNLCDEMSVDPSATCYVGDWAQDMRAAKEADLIPIGLTRAYETRGVLLQNGASIVIDQLIELTELIH